MQGEKERPEKKEKREKRKKESPFSLVIGSLSPALAPLVAVSPFKSTLPSVIM